MSYKVIRDSNGVVVCFGQNDNNYEPVIPDGCVASIEEVQPVFPIVPNPTLAEQIMNNPVELAKLKAALGL